MLPLSLSPSPAEGDASGVCVHSGGKDESAHQNGRREQEEKGRGHTEVGTYARVSVEGGQEEYERIGMF